MNTVSIILPCYNEQESLPLYFKAVDPVLARIEDFSFRFILVNDGSKDKTPEVMEKLYKERDDITIVNESRNFGQNAALSAGLSLVKDDFCIIMDVDLQDPVEVIEGICKKFQEGYDVVNPHRADRKEDTFFKRTTAKMFYTFLNSLEGQEVVPENVNCYRGLSKKAVDLINSLEEKDRYLISEIPYIGLKTATIDFDRAKRDAGTSKYSLSKLILHALNVISSTTASPLYLPLKTSLALFPVNLLGTLAFFVLWILALNATIPNVGIYSTLLILFVALLSLSVILFFIGILGVYLHNILINTRKRPSYIIESVESKEKKQ